MYVLTDTIVAVSSPNGGPLSIIRMTGPGTVEVCRKIFSPAITIESNSIVAGTITMDDELSIETNLYLFFAPHSYTGETVGELHICASEAVVEVIIQNLLATGLRIAGPGEFTARAFLNGKMDLTQAEAVNEIISSSNSLQLAAAEKVLGGRLSDAAARINSQLMDAMSLIEAGLDFSGENIDFISRDAMAAKLTETKSHLEQLLHGSINYESIVDLPAVGIAGAPNAGKSSLLNALLGSERSIVSEPAAAGKTTRDVLTAPLELEYCKCILFDCAGILNEPETVLDELAQQAAISALQNSNLVLFCVDVSKADWDDDVSIRRSACRGTDAIIFVATKADLLNPATLTRRLDKLNEKFGAEFMPVSAKTGCGLTQLSERIDKTLVAGTDTQTALSDGNQNIITLTSRHRRSIAEAMNDLVLAITEVKAGNDEVAAMFLRSASQAVSGIGSAAEQNLDEQILERIFSRFCIGK